MTQAYDINIEQGQKITKGATVTVAVDFFEINKQSFSVSSATVSMYNGAGTVDTNVDGQSATVTTGLRSSVRVQYTIQGSNTTSLTEGDDYSLVWTLTLGDGQTRIARQGLEVRAA